MRRVLAALALILLAVVGLAGPASADELVIRKVDTAKFPTVVVSAQLNGAPADLSKVTLRENGQIINDIDVVPLGRTDTKVGTVLVIDTSGSMNQNGKLEAAKAAARQFVQNRQANDQIALVAFSAQPRVLVNFTNDPNLLLAGINDLVASGETALWDGVRTGVGLYTDRPDLQPNVVLLSDGKDTASTSTYDQAKSAAQGAHATVYAVGLTGGDFESGQLKDLAASTGGIYLETADPAALSGLYKQVQTSLQNQYEVTYQSKSTSGTIDIILTFGNTQATASVPTGGVSQGTATQPEVVDASGGIFGFLGGSLGKWLSVILVLAAAAIATYGIILITTRERSTLETALQPYSGDAPEGGGSLEALAEEAGPASMVGDSAFLQRAIDTTARFAEERGILAKVESMLEQADMPLRAAEALFFYLTGTVIFTLLAVILTRSLLWTAVVLIIAAVIPLGILPALAARRKRVFTSQLPDMLQLMSGSLRAGYSLMQGVEAVAQEVDDPMGRELRRVLTEARLGRVLEDSLDDMADRMSSDDFKWAVMAVRIQREVGGNLAELLSTVAETMIARERLRREVRALTAEGRISALVLGLLPVGLGVVLYAMNPDYMKLLFNDGFGQVLLIGSVLLALVGFYWMKKTIEIDI